MSHTAGKQAHITVTVVNPTDAEIDDLGSRHNLHPLILEDLQAGRQQPKFERPGEHLYLSLWDMNARADDGPSAESELAIIFDENLLLVVQRGHEASLRDLNAALAAPGTLRITSTISAVHRLLDIMVSDFVSLGAAIEKDLAAVEDEVFDSSVREDYRRIYRLRSRIGQIDRAASGLSEAMRSARREMQAMTAPEPHLRPYFSHLEHDAVGAAHLSSAQHKELDAVVSSHESNVATRQNQDMRTISAYAALLAVPTVVAGLYGMNFKNLPLLGLELGWLIVVAGVLTLDVVTYVLFRRRGWLGGAPSTRSDGESSDQT